MPLVDYPSGYPHVGCYSDWKIQRDIDDDYSVSMRSKAAIEACFNWANRKRFRIFAISGKECHSGVHMHMRYKDYGRSEACSKDGTGGRNAYDLYLVISEWHIKQLRTTYHYGYRR